MGPSLDSRERAVNEPRLCSILQLHAGSKLEYALRHRTRGEGVATMLHIAATPRAHQNTNRIQYAQENIVVTAAVHGKDTTTKTKSAAPSSSSHKNKTNNNIISTINTYWTLRPLCSCVLPKIIHTLFALGSMCCSARLARNSQWTDLSLNQ